MHARRILSLLAPVLLAPILGAGLALILLFSLSPNGADPAAAAPAAPSPLQPRWLELLRQDAVKTPLSPANGFTLNLNLTLKSLAGFAPTLQEVTAHVLRGGEQIAQGAALPVPDPSGNFYMMSLAWQSYPCPPDYCYPNGFEPGDQVWVAQGSATISMTAPTLTARAAPLEDSLSGEAPASAALTAIVIPYADPAGMQTFAFSADPEGHYLLDLGASLDLHRQDSGYVLVEVAPGRRAYRYFIAPLLRAQVGGAVISAVISPDTPIAITRLDSNGQVISQYSAYSDSSGEFILESLEWWNPFSHLSPGEALVAEAETQVFSMTIPTLTAASDLANQQVSGSAAPGAALEARRYAGPLYLNQSHAIWKQTPVQTVSITASPGGAYSAGLSLEPGDYVAVFQTLPDENQAYARSATPAIHALMNSPTTGYTSYLLIQGQVDQALTPLTVTVQGPSGYFKDWSAVRAGSNGAFDYYATYLALDTGDILRVISPEGEEIVFTLPHLTAQADVDRSTVFGKAPPGSRLLVEVYNASPPFSQLVLSGVESLDGGGGGEPAASQVVTASASGEYLADFSPDWVFYPNYTYGQTTLEDPPGYRASRVWSASGCPPRLLRAQVGGNRLVISGDWNCTGGYLRLLDAQRVVKAETQLNYYAPEEKGGWRVDLYDSPEGNPVRIVTGDKIEISYLGEVTTNVVPKLSAQVDKAASLVSGQAPAGARLSIGLKHADDAAVQEIAVVTATQSGAFTVDLSGEYAYQTGDRIIAALSGGEVAFYALAIPPAMRVQLYNSDVTGWLPPLTPFSLSHTRGITTTSQEDVASGTEGEIYTYLHDANWHAINLSPGDRLDLTAAGQTYSLTLPDLTAHLDRQAARLSGQAPPNAHLRATISDSDENSYAQITVPITASAQGEYSLEFPQLLPLGDTYGALAYLHPAGHQVNLDFSTPRWRITLDSNCASVVMPVSGAPAQVTLSKPNGWKETVDLPSNYNFSEIHACFSRAVRSGDLLELDDNQGNQLSFLVPLLEARHDYLRQALIGKAAPGNTVKVVFETRYTQVTRTPWLEPDGSFGIDTSDLQLMLGPGNGGSALLTDAQGNEVYRFFQITGVQVFLPIAPREE